MNSDYLDLLKKQFNNRLGFREKRPGIFQVIAPLYYEDGDMLDIFIENSPEASDKVRICDYGMTLMHLSYSYDIDTPNKERIFNKILVENALSIEEGNIYLDVNPNNLYIGMMQFAQAVGKVSNMRMFRREVIQSLFYEMLEEFIDANLQKYNPVSKILPIPKREELEVDYSLTVGKRPVYLFGIKDATKARLTTISCLEFQKANIPFRSVIVHEDFDSLSKKDRARITSAVDKQFIDLDDFKNNAVNYFEREAV